MRGIIGFVLGLSLVAILAYLAHGPLGTGQDFVDRLESRAEVALGNAGGALMQVRMTREPALSREALISGDADALTRARLSASIVAVPGMRSARWEDVAPGASPPTGLALLTEVLILLTAAYAAGFAIGGLLWGRRSA